MEIYSTFYSLDLSRFSHLLQSISPVTMSCNIFLKRTYSMTRGFSESNCYNNAECLPKFLSDHWPHFAEGTRLALLSYTVELLSRLEPQIFSQWMHEQDGAFSHALPASLKPLPALSAEQTSASISLPTTILQKTHPQQRTLKDAPPATLSSPRASRQPSPAEPLPTALYSPRASRQPSPAESLPTALSSPPATVKRQRRLKRTLENVGGVQVVCEDPAEKFFSDRRTNGTDLYSALKKSEVEALRSAIEFRARCLGLLDLQTYLIENLRQSENTPFTTQTAKAAIIEVAIFYNPGVARTDISTDINRYISCAKKYQRVKDKFSLSTVFCLDPGFRS